MAVMAVVATLHMSDAAATLLSRHAININSLSKGRFLYSKFVIYHPVKEHKGLGT